MTTPDDPFDLERFIDAQQHSYEQALAEIRSGLKRSHWMWFIFPQFAGLGSSPAARLYAIKSPGEAQAYLAHPVLRARLIACTEAVLAVQHRTAEDIFGHPDDWKLRSCATLFAAVSSEGSVFHRLLDKYYHGEKDQKTLELMKLPG